MSITKVSYSMIDGAVVNILDFGAVGNGTTDDTVAIQAAINSLAITSSANATGGGTVYIPAGKFRITSTIKIGHGITLLGNGAGGYPFIGVNSQMSQIYADFGANVNQWTIDSATYVTATGLPVAYNAWVNGSVDTDFNSLHNVAIKGLVIRDANEGLQTNVPWGAIRLVGCPNAIIENISIIGFGIGVQLNTSFGTSISKITSMTNYYGLLCYNANNNIYVQGQFDKMVSPATLTVPVGRIPSWMPDAATFASSFYMNGAHYQNSKGVTIASDNTVGTNSAVVDVILQYWEDCVFLYNSYATTFTSLYVENTAAEFVVSSAQASWQIINLHNFTSSSAYVVDAGLQTVGYVNVGGNNLSTNFFNNLWGSNSPTDPSYVLVENEANVRTAFAIPDHPRLRRLVGQNRGTVTMGVTSATGAITSVTNEEAYYIKYGNQVTIYFTFTVADNGTGAAYITVTGMPYPCSSTIGASGTAHNSTLGLCAVWVAPIFSTFNISLYDGTYPAVTGDVISGSFTYFVDSTAALLV
jgi:hypothetical protein